MTEQQRTGQAAAQLLHWYDASRRILPWREQSTPYRVWVSEIMLQQTRVEAVKPYYDRFLAALPDVWALAEASEDSLMKLWEGLGYYGRVRNLQKAAQIICQEHNGLLPGDRVQLAALPGIGPYTAGAIASIAFGECCAAVDGNVLRVLSRLLARDWDISSAETKRTVTKLIEQTLPADRPGDFNQSLMELGAVVCLPNGAPLCGNCPLRSLCLAHDRDLQADLPVKTKKKPRRVEHRTVYLLFHEGKVALQRRENKGLLKGMWEFPNCLPEEDALEKLGIPFDIIEKGSSAKHIFTHIEWRMTGVMALAKEPGAFIWVDARSLEQEIALPSAFRVFRAQALNRLKTK